MQLFVYPQQTHQAYRWRSYSRKFLAGLYLSHAAIYRLTFDVYSGFYSEHCLLPYYYPVVLAEPAYGWSQVQREVIYRAFTGRGASLTKRRAGVWGEGSTLVQHLIYHHNQLLRIPKICFIHAAALSIYNAGCSTG